MSVTHAYRAVRSPLYFNFLSHGCLESVVRSTENQRLLSARIPERQNGSRPKTIVNNQPRIPLSLTSSLEVPGVAAMTRMRFTFPDTR